MHGVNLIFFCDLCLWYWCILLPDLNFFFLITSVWSYEVSWWFLGCSSSSTWVFESMIDYYCYCSDNRNPMGGKLRGGTGFICEVGFSLCSSHNGSISIVHVMQSTACSFSSSELSPELYFLIGRQGLEEWVGDHIVTVPSSPWPCLPS